MTRAYIYAAAILIFSVSVAGSSFLAYRHGKTTGAAGVQVTLEKERRQHAQAALEASQEALERSRKAAEEAREQQAEDLAEALAASEKRQAEAVRAAVRQATLEARTREPGSAYTSPACVLDADTMEKLNEALK